MLFNIILLIELGCVAFFLCRYLDVCTKKKNSLKTISRKPKRDFIKSNDLPPDEIMLYLENIDNYRTENPQRNFK